MVSKLSIIEISNTGVRQVSQKSLVCWTNTALPYHLIDFCKI